MEEEKKKRKNKKKKNKQTKGIENNAAGAEESASSNQNHAAEIRGSETHTDDTSGIDEDPNRHDTDGAKVGGSSQKSSASKDGKGTSEAGSNKGKEKITPPHDATDGVVITTPPAKTIDKGTKAPEQPQPRPAAPVQRAKNPRVQQLWKSKETVPQHNNKYQYHKGNQQGDSTKQANNQKGTQLNGRNPNTTAQPDGWMAVRGKSPTKHPLVARTEEAVHTGNTFQLLTSTRQVAGGQELVTQKNSANEEVTAVLQAIFEEKLKQLAQEKDASLLRESILDERIKQLQNENNNHMQKEAGQLTLDEAKKDQGRGFTLFCNPQASFEEKIMQLQKEISSLRRQEAIQEEKIRQLHMEKDLYLQKEAEFEMKNSQLQSEKNSWLQKEAGLEKRNDELVDEVEKLNSKRVMNPEVSLEKKVREMEKETENRVQKEKSFREIISNLSGDNALLEAQVKEFEELRTNIVQENQLLKENIQVLQTQVSNLEKSATLPYSPTGSKMNTHENGDLNSEGAATRALVDRLVGENAELVEKVNKLYVELERRGPPMEVSSFLGSDIITRSSEAAHVANESALGSHKMPGAVQEHEVDYATEPKSKPSEAVLQSGERLQPPKDPIDKAATDHGHVPKIDSRIDVNSSEIESDEIVQIPLDENEVQSADLEAANVDQASEIESDEIVQIPLDENEVQSADLEATNVDQDEEEVPLTNAPLIGAPFRLISFVARYVSGADLVNKNSATSNP
ncbi:hypothetical protein RND71_021794 [Anisodus tanguticus]|uniref:Uncharacterized protein n=1 Tax=Anisodus tanguticus TaxID=243964 RepID=A0AAE1RXN7_9SOLA|nr:hypothetical protein RND71_021794 [Anisodus tanguticus]